MNSMNRQPDWVHMDVCGAVADAREEPRLGIGPQDSPAERALLSVTINFNEHYIDVPLLGRTWFGLSGGDLTIALSNGTLPYALRKPEVPLPISIPVVDRVKVTKTEKQGSESGGEIGGGIDAKGGSVTAKVSMKTTGEVQDVHELDREIKHVLWEVTPKGSPEMPRWNFRCQTPEKTLAGTFLDLQLGTVMIRARPCSAEASFCPSARDIRLRAIESLVSWQITRKREALFGILMRKYWVRDYLSRAQLSL
jgi:hypothetical protein